MATDSELPNFGEYAAEKPAGGLKAEEKQLAMMCHMAALPGMLLCGLTPVGPAVAWQMKRQVSPFVDEAGKEALNFQLNIFVLLVATAFIATITTGVLLVLPVAVAIYGGVMAVIAGMRANEGKQYRYPGTVRVIK